MTPDDRPRGRPVPDWTPPPRPDGAPLRGNYTHLEKLDADAHAALLFKAFDGHDWIWDYMSCGPFSSSAMFHRQIRDLAQKPDATFYAIRDTKTGEFGGFASLMRCDPAAGSVEVGFIAMAPRLQRTRAATEAMYLLMAWAFDAGYRRYEWKCDALNLPSRRAAQRLGFSFEGIFRQALVVKDRNRDTAWFSVIDSEWPALREAFQFWLSPANFDEAGRQRERLSDLTALVRAADDPAL